MRTGSPSAWGPGRNVGSLTDGFSAALLRAADIAAVRAVLAATLFEKPAAATMDDAAASELVGV